MGVEELEELKQVITIKEQNMDKELNFFCLILNI